MPPITPVKNGKGTEGKSGKDGKDKAKSPKTVRISEPGKTDPATSDRLGGQARARLFKQKSSIPMFFEGGEKDVGEWSSAIRKAVKETKWNAHKQRGESGDAGRPCWVHWMAPLTQLECPWAGDCKFCHQVDSQFGDAARAEIAALVVADLNPP